MPPSARRAAAGSSRDSALFHRSVAARTRRLRTRGAHRAVNGGAFVVFEGLDGCGKSTQRALLAARLRARGADVLETAEPYEAGIWGPKIRAMARSGAALAPAEELRWFLEQRREHVRERIAPALAAGRIVLCDRYFLSTAAYQGARGLDADAILTENEREFPLPDLVLLFDVPVALALARIAARGGVGEPVFERRGFLERVADNFLRLERPYIARIDGAETPDEVADEVARTVEARLGIAR